MKWLAELDVDEILNLGLILVIVLLLGLFFTAIIADKKTECYYIDANSVKAFIPWEADSIIFTSQNIDDVIRVYGQVEHCKN